MTFFLECMIRVSLIMAAALLAHRALRNSSAAVRHVVLSAAVFVAMMVPLLTIVMPAWHILPGISQPEEATVTSSSGFVSDASSASVTTAALPRQPAWSTQIVALLPQGIWLAGVALGLAALVTGGIRLARVASASKPMPSGTWTELANSISRNYGVRRQIRLLQSPNASILITWGLLRPKVVLPAGAADWGEERAHVVLSHELAHIRRYDWLTLVVAEMLRTIYWFNPLVWIVCNRLRLESEHACDDAALSQGIEAPEYAAHLLELARTLNTPNRSWSAALAMARPSTVERRFKAMLNPDLNRRPITRLTMVAVAILAFCITLPLSALTTVSPSIALTAGAVIGPTAEPVKAVVISPETKSLKTAARQAATTGTIKGKYTTSLVEGARMVLSTGDHQVVKATTADQFGEFSFSGVPVGKYALEGTNGLGDHFDLLLEAKENGKKVWNFGGPCCTSVTIEFTLDGREKGAGAEKLDAAFRAGPPQAPAGRVSGIVTDDNGKLVVGATVTISSSSGTSRTTATNGAGVYGFEQLPSGTYTVEVYATPAGQPYRARTSLSLQDNASTRLNITMPATVAENGMGQGGSISGKVTDPAGLPVPGAQIVASNPNMIDGSRQLVTDQAGVYNFRLLAPGVFRVAVSLPGFKTLNMDNVVVEAGNQKVVDAHLAVAALAEEMTITSPARPYSAEELSQARQSELERAAEPEVECFANAPAPTSNHVLPYGGNVKAPKRVAFANPLYPLDAKTQNVSGLVVLEATVAADGRMAINKIISGNPLLSGAVVTALKQWCYEPTLLDGTAVPVTVTVTARFVLAN